MSISAVPEVTPVRSPAPAAGGSKFGVLIVVFILAASLGMIGYFLIWPSYQRDQLLQNGIQAEGTITAIEPTGSIVNSQPEARVTVSIRPTGGTAYTAVTKMVINAIYAPQYQPGKNVLVRYDKNNPSEFAIEFVQGN